MAAPKLAPRDMLIVDRDRFRIKHYKRGRLRGKYALKKSYKCAVGAIGYETPRGMYYIVAKAKNPAWTMPKSNWVDEKDWGRVVPADDPSNPLKGAFLAIYDGVGIHGTSNTKSLGTQASHGCIRVTEEDALELFERIPVNTPIYIF